MSSHDDAALNADQFKAPHSLIQGPFPRLHAAPKREVVNDLSLSLHPGGRRSQGPSPSCPRFTRDVVPIAAGTRGRLSRWHLFAGEVKDGLCLGSRLFGMTKATDVPTEAVEMLVAAEL